MKSSQTIFALGMLVVFALTTNTAVAQVFNFNPNAAIDDNNSAGISVMGTVSNVDWHIEDIDVGLDITHTYQGDFIITLEHNGVTVPLIYRPGQEVNQNQFGFSANNFGGAQAQFVLDDDAANGAYDSGNNEGWGNVAHPGIADVDGSWVPYGEFMAGGMGGLSAFNGMDANGVWTLNISDNAAGDTGTIDSWSLRITPVPEPSSAFALLMGMSGLAFVRRRK